MKHIAILDFGSQYTHLIARRVRELGVRSEIYSTDVSAHAMSEDVLGIILSGGPQSVYDTHSVQADPALFGLGKPMLGLCYGHQLMAHVLGGSVAPGAVREYGKARLLVANADSLFAHTKPETIVWMSHGDSVTALPDGFSVMGKTADCPIAAMAHVDKKMFGVQFHPEVRHTEEGMSMLRSFVFDICKAEENWHIEDLVDTVVRDIRKKTGTKNVFMLISGGVDSAVAFALLSKALGTARVHGLYIDIGYMRKNESIEIPKNFAAAHFDNVHTHDASALFCERLAGVIDPEEKRNIIGKTFLDVKDAYVTQLGFNKDEWILGQGTIYPDTIETGGTQHADTIKTHHNRIDAIQQMIAQGRVIEPIAEFYKDEVRSLGALLGLPEALIQRHPFPGPGLAIRILCTNGAKEALPSVSPKLPERTYGALLPIRSVGVQGDNRTYAHPFAIWGTADWHALDAFSRMATNTHRDINRVVLLLNAPTGRAPIFELSAKPQTLTLARVALLQDIDTIVTEEIQRAGVYNAIWQFPVVLAPIGHTTHESIILRPVVSQEAMTAHFAELDDMLLSRITERILATKKIDYIFYDITNKPPGTIEWE